MAELTTLARPYAKAAFEFALSESNMKGWSNALILATKVALQSAMQTLFTSPNLTAEQKSTALIGVCGDGLSDKQKNFLIVLAHNHRLSLLPQVQQLFELYKANKEKTVDVDIQTAFEISPELKHKLAAALTKKLDREVSLQTAVDKSLLGGALIRAGDAVIDGSVRGRLAKLTAKVTA